VAAPPRSSLANRGTSEKTSPPCLLFFSFLGLSLLCLLVPPVPSPSRIRRSVCCFLPVVFSLIEIDRFYLSSIRFRKTLFRVSPQFHFSVILRSLWLRTPGGSLRNLIFFFKSPGGSTQGASSKKNALSVLSIFRLFMNRLSTSSLVQIPQHAGPDRTLHQKGNRASVDSLYSTWVLI